MRWSFVIEQKIKAALLLSIIMLLVVLNSLISRSNINGIEKSFNSIYSDRLIPAIDMVYLMESLYNKRLVLEKYLLLSAEIPSSEITNQLASFDRQIDSLVNEFEKTYLVEQESKSFIALKKDIKEYSFLEKSILALAESGHKEKGWSEFEGTANVVFRRAIVRLNELTHIQSVVGEELRKTSKSDVSLFNFYATLQIVLAIVIGGIILSLIQSSRIINPRHQQPPNLN